MTTIENIPPEAPAVGGSVELAPGVVVADGVLAFSYTTSRGPGGQNVNKKATRAELRVRLGDLPVSHDARERLAGLLGRRLTDEGVAVITGGEHRSQGQNRAECLERLRDLLVRALTRPKARRRTRPSRGAVARRLESKKKRGDLKRSRGGGHD
ncbi:MAG: alternative ribosome rescue aminoacyl-tRNA hydrolase ArfB [Phycisphaerales bacterium]